MFDTEIYLQGLLVALLIPALTWVVSVFKRDVSIVDSIWSLMILAGGAAGIAAAICVQKKCSPRSLDFSSQRSSHFTASYCENA